MNRCDSIHNWSGSRCIRLLGHDGYCHSKAYKNGQTISRAEWTSREGKFHSHHQYAAIYPSNMTTAPTGEKEGA